VPKLGTKVVPSLPSPSAQVQLAAECMDTPQADKASAPCPPIGKVPSHDVLAAASKLGPMSPAPDAIEEEIMMLPCDDPSAQAARSRYEELSMIEAGDASSPPGVQRGLPFVLDELLALLS
jgi:hypothetical protein